MDTNKKEKIEALETLVDFNDRLIKNIPTIISELTIERQPDTNDYLNTIINAINWEISVTNATLDILNDGIVRIDKDTFNEKVKVLSNALSLKVDSMIASALQELLPFFVQLGNAAHEVI